MYKAILEIGGYEVGEEVPIDKALAWLEAYDTPHVKKVEGVSKKPSGKKVEDRKLETSAKKSPEDPMLDDYLGRNTSVVKKNIEEDKLSRDQLANLLELEKIDKKREIVIKSIEKRLGVSGT